MRLGEAQGRGRAPAACAVRLLLSVPPVVPTPPSWNHLLEAPFGSIFWKHLLEASFGSTFRPHLLESTFGINLAELSSHPATHCLPCHSLSAPRPATLASGRPETGHWATPFEYCRAVCRTTARSTQHENAFILDRKHCFSKVGAARLIVGGCCSLIVLGAVRRHPFSTAGTASQRWMKTCVCHGKVSLRAIA